MALRKILRRNDLEALVFDTEAQAGQAAAVEGGRRIAEIQRRQGSATIIFAAAVSQHELLTALSENESIDWNRVRAFHMDEYIGLPKGDARTLAHFFTRHPGINPGSFEFLDPEAADAEAECRRYESLLRAQPVDIVFCGIGDNGHLAFNEPHIADFREPRWVRTVEIDDVSKQQQVNAGNFPDLAAVPTLAYTLTIPALISGACMLCVAPTGYKAAAVTATLEGPVGESCPASILRTHPDAILYLDAQSGGLL